MNKSDVNNKSKLHQMKTEVKFGLINVTGFAVRPKNCSQCAICQFLNTYLGSRSLARDCTNQAGSSGNTWSGKEAGSRHTDAYST
jgi:hypothetical protein